jgi:RHS repeat-associated protein
MATDFADINGDGLPDRVAITRDAGGASAASGPADGGKFDGSMSVRLNLGGRFLPQIGRNVPTIASPTIPLPTGILPGALELEDERGVVRASDVSLNSAQSSVSGLGGGVAYSVQRTYTDLIDVTGDGLPDRVMKVPGEQVLHVQPNTGGPDPLQFGPTQDWTMPDLGFDPASTFGFGQRVGFGSYDTLAFSETKQWNFSAGATFQQVIFPYVCFVEEGSVQHGTESTRSQMRMMDVNGDGFTDQVLKQDGNPMVRVRLNLEGAQHYNLLKTVHLPLQGTYTLDYTRTGNKVEVTPLGNPTDPNNTKVDMPRSQWALSLVSVANGPNTPSGNAHVPYDVRTTTFEYTDATHLQGTGFYDRVERKDYGYNRVLTNRPDGSVREDLYYNHDFYRQGLLRKTVDRMADGTLFQIVDHVVNLQPVANTNSAAIPAENTRTTRFYEGQTANDANFGRMTQQTRVFDDDGDVTMFTDLGEPETPSDDVTYKITYRSIAATHIVKPDSVTAKNSSDLTLSARTVVYNDDGSMKSSTEYLRDGINPITGTAYDGSALTNPTWAFTYDSRGNLRTLTDPKQYVLTYTYDDLLHTHVNIVQDSLGYYDGIHVDARFGVADFIRDPNSQDVAVNHDQFGRPFEIQAGRDVTNRTIGTSLTYSVGSTPGPNDPELFPAWALATHRAESSSPGVSSADFVDGLGRHVQTITPARQADLTTGTESTGINISGLVTYDARSRVYQQFQPGFLAGTNVDIRFHRTPAPGANPTTYSYDLFNRLRATRTPDALGTATDPQGNPVALTLIDFNFGSLDGMTRLVRQTKDPLGKVRTVYLSARGETLGVLETNTLTPGAMPTPLTTRYTYDPLSRLGTVKDARGNLTSVLYDTQSRMISLASPDAGSTEYRYDLGGNLAQKITPNLRASNKLIKYSYTFNRLDSIVYPASAPVTFVYGSPTEDGDQNGNLAARVKQIVDESGVEFRKYDDLGQITEVTKIPAGQGSVYPAIPYTTKYRYDELGRIMSMVYPDGEVVTYDYEESGAPRTVTGTMGTTTTNYVQRINYDQFGHRSRVLLGNSALVQYTYFPDTERLKTQTSILGGLGGRVVQNLGYTYDVAGNITKLIDSVAVPTGPPPVGTIVPGSTSYTFGYDDLYQLTTATGQYLGCASGCNNARKYSVGMTYDEIGNIKHKTQNDVVMTPTGVSTAQPATSYDVGYTYGGARPHAVTAVGSAAYTYDADGNQLTSSGTFGIARTLTWNEEDRVRSEADRGFTDSFLYDAEGNRTHKRRSTLETVYVNPNYVVRAFTTESKHIMVGDTRVATVMATIRTPGNPSTAQNPSYFYYLPDHLQSTRLSTDAAGNILQHDEYFPSGETWFHEQRNNDSRNSQPYMFSAKEQDESGLYYFGARYYDPRVGNWLSPDPILASHMRGEVNGGVFAPRNLGLYTYTWNNSIRLRDPNGLWAEGWSPIGDAGQLLQDVVEGIGKSITEAGHAFGRGFQGELDAPGSNHQVANLAGVLAADAMLFVPLPRSEGAGVEMGSRVASAEAATAEGGAGLRVPAGVRTGGPGASGVGSGSDPVATAGAGTGPTVRPAGVPADWIAKPSKTGGGTRFVDPKNPHNSVRVMPGDDPNSPFPNSRQPYVRHLRDGQSLDVNGNVVPKNTPEAHIPAKDFKGVK